jgi:hypothetical protein
MRTTASLSRPPSRATSARGVFRAARRLSTFAAALPLCASLALGAAGCKTALAPPALATGERPVTGVPRYDRFFADVNAALVAVQEARTEEAEARGMLARRLGMPEAVAVDVLGVRLRERTARLYEAGLSLELEFTGIEDDSADEHTDASVDAEANAESAAAAAAVPEEEVVAPTATLRTPGREPVRRELRLLEAIAQAALSGATVYVNMGRERRRAEHLLRELGELRTQLETSFVNADERERTRAKLNEAEALLPQLNTQAREVSGAADTLVSLLDEAANTVPVPPGKRRPGTAPPRNPASGPGVPPLLGAKPAPPARPPAPPAPAPPAPKPPSAAPAAQPAKPAGPATP